MSESLKSFVIAVGENPELATKFKDNPTQVMQEHNLSEEEQALILSGDKEAIGNATGLDENKVNLFIF